MDTINAYRQTVQQLVKRYASYQPNNAEINHELVMDTERDHYEVIVIGWQKGKRVYHPMMHLDIVNGQIWIQVNNTDRDLTHELVDAGIPEKDIILAFLSEQIRRSPTVAIS